MNLAEQIAGVLKVHPGPKGREIAEKLAGRLTRASAPPSTPPLPQTALAKLCRYYLDCISQESELDISVFANGWFGLDYVELGSMPLVSGDKGVFETAKHLLDKTRRDRGRLVIYLGYPVRLRHVRGRNGWEGFRAEPVCLWTFQERPESPGDAPAVSDEMPVFNFAVLRCLARTTGNFLDEAIQLAEELGITAAGKDPPGLDELFDRLHTARSEWDWKEYPDVHSLSGNPALSEFTEEGIYNRAILVAGERPLHTQALEIELGKLAQLKETDYANTALGQWVAGQSGAFESRSEEPLVEVLPLNSGQRAAVRRGLDSSLTVVTGPAGTGKSQVAASLVMNAAWRSKKVLFAGRNEKAVDVVETRCNNLGLRPVLLRVGGKEYQANLAEYLDSLLAATATRKDKARFKESLAIHKRLRRQLQDLDGRLQHLIACRNRVDGLEQQVEPFRSLFGETCFRGLCGSDVRSHTPAVTRLKSACARVSPATRGFWGKILWPFVKSARLRKLWDAAEAVRDIIRLLGMDLPSDEVSEDSLDRWVSLVEEVDCRFAAGCLVARYFDELSVLEAVPAAETFAVSLRNLEEDAAGNSVALWDSWLRLQPRRLSRSQRKCLDRYVALLRIILAGSQQQTSISKRVFHEYYEILPEVTSSLTCWTVTSLSARGRVPFEPGLFDLVVIDEASQCDIASALPLLYRAKAAVIIGDPKQLRHISGVTERQDRQLMSKHALAGEWESWAYSANSLFDLARSLCGHDDVVNLRDNHRSHAEIIGFSNGEFYEGRLRVATSYGRLRSPSGPAVRWVDVKGRVTRPANGGAINEDEARAVVEELKRLMLEEHYQGSVGVVSPFPAQANRIRDLAAQEKPLEQALTSGALLVDTVHRFQGDERDLMIFSPVASDGMTESVLSFLRRNGNLFNVAITRARSALVAVGDRDAAQHCGVGYLARFARYSASSRRGDVSKSPEAADLGPAYPPIARPEFVSPWEHVLYKALYFAGLRPVPQYSVEQYLLDFAIIIGDRKLNVEVDGEYYHRNWDSESCRRDQLRSQRLIELGWDVMRFWVYQVRDDLPACVARVKTWAERSGALGAASAGTDAKV
jgi:very-short-patch-repair endonuclease/polyhydroxyalkanoate synthesis regulator phasin